MGRSCRIDCASPWRGGVGRDAEGGVVDGSGRVFGYRNLIVCDGSILPANPGVNPSLTITALAEHVMSCVPPAGTDRPG